MYANKNYEWFDTFDEDNWHWLPDSLYWASMYNKIYNQGRAKDKVRLKELYEERGVDDGWLVKIMSRVFTPSDRYHYAVMQFITETKYASMDDDSYQKADMEQRIAKRKIRNTLNEHWGFDVYEFDNEAIALETELERNHTKKQSEFIYLGEDIVPQYPSMIEIVLSPIVKRGYYDINYYDKRCNEKFVTVYYEIHDKYKGFYSLILWTDNNEVDNLNSNHESLRMSVFATSLGGKNGILTWNNLYPCLVERANIVINRIRNKNKKFEVQMNPNRTIKKETKKKEPKVDISKINKALGIDESEELNGDIF